MEAYVLATPEPKVATIMAMFVTSKSAMRLKFPALMEAKNSAMLVQPHVSTIMQWHARDIWALVLLRQTSLVRRLQSNVQMVASVFAMLEPKDVQRTDQYVTQTRLAMKLRLIVQMEARSTARLEPLTAERIAPKFVALQMLTESSLV